MEIRSSSDNQHEITQLVNSIVVPRPIAWITSRSATDHLNLSPFSYFQVVSVDPVIVMISFNDEKHTYLNICETKEFVINSVTTATVDLAVMSSAEVGRSVDEASALGIDFVPSVTIAAPRLAVSPAALECVLHSTTRVGTGRIVFATVQHVYVDDAVIGDQGRIDLAKFRPVGRMGGNQYAVADSWRGIDRPTVDAFHAHARSSDLPNGQ